MRLPGGSQRPHQQQRRRLAQRIRGQGRRGHTNHLFCLARGRRRRDQGIGHLAMQMDALVDEAGQWWDIAQISQDGAPPQPARLPEQRVRLGRVGREQLASPDQQCPRFGYVETLRPEVEGVPVRAGLQAFLGRPEV